MTTQLNKREKDIFRLLQSNCHVASRNYNVQMKRFINHVNKEGVPIFNIDETYERIRLAARIIAGVPDLADVYAISSREYGQRAVIKFASHTKCSVTSSSRWTPGSLTNHQTKQFKEPRVIIVADPYADFKAIKEASYTNIPVIALCDSHNNLKFVDVVIPCNNNSTESISMIFWMLAREVLTLTGKIDQHDDDWNEVLVDLFYYKDVNERQVQDEISDEDNEDEPEGEAEEEEEN
jgi:small subunit ribosomal protein SAe